MLYLQVWTPTLVVGNPTRKVSAFRENVMEVRVMKDGQIIWFPGDVFYTTCYPNIYSYPLDSQRCFISIVPFGFFESEIVVRGVGQSFKANNYQDGGEWVLEKTESEDMHSQHFSIVRFYFTFNRRSEFFVINIILPIIFLSCLNCLVFLLPSESGERVSFSVTVLLSFAVFLTIIGDNIPKTSDPVPLLCYYLVSVFTGSALIMVCTVHSLAVRHRDDSIPISGLYKFLTSRKTKTTPGSVLCSQKPVDSPHTEGDWVASLHNQQGCNEYETDKPVDKIVTWHGVSACINKICFVGFVLYFSLCSLVFLTVIGVSSSD